MGKLGQLLVARGWITVQQLTRALQSQNAVGGRLGTCLIEMDVLGEELLARSLSEQQGVPAAGIEELRGIPDEVLHLIPEKLARRCRAVPFRVAGGRLDVAMLDPRNLVSQDEIAFACGRRVKVHVLHELRIYEALQRYYREDCPSRYSLLLDRLNRARYLWGRGDSVGAATADSRGDRTEVLSALPSGDLLGALPHMAPPPLPEPALPPLPRRRSLFRSRTAATPTATPADPGPAGSPAAGGIGGIGDLGEVLPPLEELDLRSKPKRQRDTAAPPLAAPGAAAAPAPQTPKATQAAATAPLQTPTSAAFAAASARDAAAARDASAQPALPVPAGDAVPGSDAAPASGRQAAAGPAPAAEAAAEGTSVPDPGRAAATDAANAQGAAPAATGAAPAAADDGDQTVVEPPAAAPAPGAASPAPDEPAASAAGGERDGSGSAPAEDRRQPAGRPAEAGRPAAGAPRPFEVVRSPARADEALPPLPAAAARAARQAADLETTVVLGPRATGAREAVTPDAATPAGAGRRGTTGPVEVIVLSPEERSALGVDEAGPQAVPAPAEPQAPARKAPADMAEVEAQLAATADREQVAHIVLAYLAQSFRRAALFQVTRQRVSAWMAAGEGIDQEAFSHYQADFDEPSVFLNLQRGSGMHIGPLPPMQAHRRLAQCWGGGLPRDCVVLPVRLRDRLVTVIYVDGGNRGFAGIDLEQMQRLRETTAAALERCILGKKRGYAQS